MIDKKREIQLSLSAYSKLLCHVMQYPYTAVNGILLTTATQSAEDDVLNIVDCVPLFHYSLSLAPMFIVALTQIEEYAASKDLQICGYYHANEHQADKDVGAVATRVADKIADNCDVSCLLMVDNEQLTHISTDVPLKAFLPAKTNDRIEWKSCEKPVLQFGDRGLSIGPEIVKKQLYRSIIDMDCHYDNVSLHWDNKAIDEVVNLFVESLTSGFVTN